MKKYFLYKNNYFVETYDDDGNVTISNLPKDAKGVATQVPFEEVSEGLRRAQEELAKEEQARADEIQKQQAETQVKQKELAVKLGLTNEETEILFS